MWSHGCTIYLSLPTCVIHQDAGNPSENIQMRSTEYLQQHCTTCFGGSEHHDDNPMGVQLTHGASFIDSDAFSANIIICLDACMFYPKMQRDKGERWSPRYSKMSSIFCIYV